MNHNPLIWKMTEYFSKDVTRIQHFMKVYAYAKMIGEEEGLDKRSLEILETAAIVHDIGIRRSEEVYGDSSGKHQEELGPFEAEEMLKGFGYDEELMKRVCYLVGHHHTYTDIDGLDYQILVEADFLVNLHENEEDQRAVKAALEHIFKTGSGKALCRIMFGV